jgi:hypothetical protein
MFRYQRIVKDRKGLQLNGNQRRFLTSVRIFSIAWQRVAIARPVRARIPEYPRLSWIGAALSSDPAGITTASISDTARATALPQQLQNCRANRSASGTL